jgi:hypothetical protein
LTSSPSCVSFLFWFPPYLTTFQELQHCSKHLSSVDDWAIASHGVQYVAKFGSTICSTHQHILANCLPGSNFFTQLFVSYVDGTDQQNRKYDWTAALRKLGAVADQVNPLCVTTEMNLGRRSMFPSVTVLQIDPGSFLLDMRCVSGNSCYVIYPPGRQSFDELRSMISGEPDGSVMIQVLSRAIPLPSGGFRCLLETKSAHG